MEPRPESRVESGESESQSAPDPRGPFPAHLLVWLALIVIGGILGYLQFDMHRKLQALETRLAQTESVCSQSQVQVENFHAKLESLRRRLPIDGFLLNPHE